MTNKAKTLSKRQDIDKKYLWDLESVYTNRVAWNQDLEKVKTLTEELCSYRGRLGESAATLLTALDKQAALEETLSKAFVFAYMRRDEDNTNREAQEMATLATAAMANYQAALSFFTPEIVELGQDTLQTFQQKELGLALYDFALSLLLREKAHILTDTEESLLAQLSEVTDAPGEIFSMLENADLSYGDITDEEGQKTLLTNGNYSTFLQSKNREVRKEAFTHMYQAFQGHINTIGATYGASVKNDVVRARLRHYSSARAQACFADNVSEDVYDNLIGAVRGSFPAFDRYMKIRKRALEVDELTMYDMHTSLVDLPKRVIPYEEAQEICLAALKPMGIQYVADMKQGFADRWVDVYETPGKTSGAYSFGTYGTKPFILLNYTDTMQDVFTTIHEMGHSMHSFYSRKEQPSIYSGHSIFTAEVASTVNENLLVKHLLNTEKDPDMTKYLLAFHAEAFRTTVFRQTMFAEFEHIVHKQVEDGGALTPDWLNETYDNLNNEYFGATLCHDDLIQYEWARIPHFYNAFYVYKYATGYSAAAALSDLILAGEKDGYLKFLASGCKDYPVELLKMAGVDMSKPAPVETAMKVFEGIVNKLDELI